MGKEDQNSKNKGGKDIELLTLKQASELLNVHPNTLRNWDNKGLFKSVRIGPRKDRRYRKNDVLSAIKNHHD